MTILGDVLEALEAVADASADEPAVRRDYRDLVESHALLDSEQVFREYLRVRLAFEVTRDGGLWQLKWQITRRPPTTKHLFEQIARADVPDESEPLAIGECDELSALFAFLARSMGVGHVGLLWPVPGHAVAVRETPGREGGTARVVVPTSQILLDDRQTLGTTDFDAYRQRRVYPYGVGDVPRGLELPSGLARFLVEQARAGLSSPHTALQRARNDRAARLR